MIYGAYYAKTITLENNIYFVGRRRSKAGRSINVKEKRRKRRRKYFL